MSVTYAAPMAQLQDVQPMDLVGRRAVITGAGRGIGRSVAELLARRGARVVVAARSLDQLQEVADGIVASGGQAAAIVADVTSDESVAGLFASAAEALDGAPDLLVNNAGAYRADRFEDISSDDWLSLYDVNVVGAVRCCRAALPAMLESSDGRIVNLASIAGMKGTLLQAPYNATKAALIALTRCLALETGESGVTVNSVCPGFVETELLPLDHLGELYGMGADDVVPMMSRRSPTGRLVTVDEVAAAVAFLCSPGAAGINAQSIVVDGGGFQH